MECNNSEKLINVMKEELKSMDDNKVQDLVEFPEGSKQVGCKWVFKTKHDLKSHMRDIRPNLLLKVTLKRIALTIKKPSLQFLRKTL